MLSPYAYYKDHKGFVKNNSGFAYAVSDTCKVLASLDNEVFLLTQSGITTGFINDNVIVLKKRWVDILFHIHIRDLRYGFSAIKGSSISKIEKLKTIYYYLNRGYTEKIIKRIKPDVIHIQSIGNYTLPYMMAARRCGVPFIVSNHGLASFLIDVDPKLKLIEGCFFEVAEKNNTIVTTVSNGIRKRISESYNLTGNNIEVIPNSISTIGIVDLEKLELLKKKLRITENDFVYICVGSISNRKNQMQVARVFSQIVREKKNCKLLFAGDGPQKEELREFIRSNNLEDYIILLGNVEHIEMPYYYSLSNCTVLASVDEGFGLPVIEGYSQGVPTVLFGDLDAAKDISFQESTIVVMDRNDNSLAEGMLKAYSTTWDYQLIKKRSLEFTSESMGKKYLKALYQAVDKGSTIQYEDITSLIVV